MPRLSGADIIVRLLERQGVDTVFGIPGGSTLPLHDALGRSAVRHVLARHEQGAGFMAQGTARLTGRPGVCIATSGPGATNLVTAVADARADSVPLVCLTGQVNRGLLGTDAFQEVDTYGLTVPIAKHNFLVRSAAELLDVIPRAFRIAASGRPGPVVVDLPRDVQMEEIDVDAWPQPGLPDAPPEPADEALSRAAELIDAAERPVLYLGGGVIQSGAATLARRLAETIGAPAAMSLMGLGALPADHPLSLGLIGMHGWRCTNMLLAECDLIVAVGVRFDDRATGRLDTFCPGASVVHIDIDPGELGKLRAAHVGVTADAAAALTAISALVTPRKRGAWSLRVAELRRSHGPNLGAADSPASLIRRIGDIAGQDAVVATDVGQHQMWTAQAWPFKRPRRYLTSGGLGTMGFGLPTAIGAALSGEAGKVVLITGDGSIMMNVQELATLAETGADVTVVVLDNGGLGLVRQQQELLFEARYTASTFTARPDFAALARAFGMPGADLAAEKDPGATLTEALRTPGPRLVRIPVDAAERVYPMVLPGRANTEMIDHATA